MPVVVIPLAAFGGIITFAIFALVFIVSTIYLIIAAVAAVLIPILIVRWIDSTTKLEIAANKEAKFFGKRQEVDISLIDIENYIKNNIEPLPRQIISRPGDYFVSNHLGYGEKYM